MHPDSYRIYALKGHTQPTYQAAIAASAGIYLDDLEDDRYSYIRDDENGRATSLVNSRGDGIVSRSSSHPAEWPSEEDTPSSGRVQGFGTVHSHLQGGNALLDSLYLILTAERLGRTAGGRQVCVRMQETARSGEPIPIEILGDESSDKLPLGVWVDGTGPPVCADPLGDGRYIAELPPLTPDAHTVTVASLHPTNPIEPVDRIVTIIDEQVMEKLFTTADSRANP